MLIRYGYDFTLDCPQPTPMVCLVSARPEHDAALVPPGGCGCRAAA
jgi:hypothetical protein